MKKKRDYQIDVLKAIGIICVIAGHTGSPFRLFFYSFHMPLFFFVSGFLRYSSKKTKTSWKSFTLSRLKTSLLPYFVFWLLSFIYLFGYSYLEHNPLPSMIGLNEIKGLLLGGHWLYDTCSNFPIWYFQFYFLAIMVFEVIVRYFNKYFKTLTYFILLFTVIPFQKLLPGRPIFHINILPAAIMFMLLGYFVKYLLDKGKFKEFKDNIPVGGLLFVGGWYFASRRYSNVAAINSYSYILGATLIILGLYIISSLFIKRKSLLYIGSNTLYILGLHLIFKEMCYKFSKFVMAGIGVNNFFCYNCLVVFIDLLLCCGVAECYLYIKKMIIEKRAKKEA